MPEYKICGICGKEIEQNTEVCLDCEQTWEEVTNGKGDDDV